MPARSHNEAGSDPDLNRKALGPVSRYAKLEKKRRLAVMPTKDIMASLSFSVPWVLGLHLA